MSKGLQNNITDVRIQKGAETVSDHYMVVMTVTRNPHKTMVMRKKYWKTKNMIKRKKIWESSICLAIYKQITWSVDRKILC